MMHSEKPVLAVIGGSGLYQMSGLEDAYEIEVNTPFGSPSSPITIGKLDGKPVAFLARHGIGHTISPSEINYKANIYALKSLHAERVVSVSACGSLREDYAPGQIVIPDQLFDFTRGTRERTFFGSGLVAHISSANPFCPQTSGLLYEAVREAGGKVHRGGTSITIEGPRFSTKAESQVFRAWGMDVIGMTASPETFLAREAELCFAVMAHVTDYDVWHVSEESVSVEMVIATLHHNTSIAQEAIKALVKSLPMAKDCTCGEALNTAMITDPEKVPPETRERLTLLIDPEAYFSAGGNPAS